VPLWQWSDFPAVEQDVICHFERGDGCLCWDAVGGELYTEGWLNAVQRAVLVAMKWQWSLPLWFLNRL